jgi:CRISPR-associated protein Cas2
MRSVFLIAYDVSDDKRRTKIHQKLKGYGEAVQYSLFRCALSPSERMRLRSEMWELINHATDRVLLIDLGPDEGRGRSALESWGKPLDDPAAHNGILIV